MALLQIYRRRGAALDRSAGDTKSCDHFPSAPVACACIRRGGQHHQALSTPTSMLTAAPARSDPECNKTFALHSSDNKAPTNADSGSSTLSSWDGAQSCSFGSGCVRGAAATALKTLSNASAISEEVYSPSDLNPSFSPSSNRSACNASAAWSKYESGAV